MNEARAFQIGVDGPVPHAKMAGVNCRVVILVRIIATFGHPGSQPTT